MKGERKKKRYTEQLRKKKRKWWEGSKNKINVDIFLKLQKGKKKNVFPKQIKNKY